MIARWLNHIWCQCGEQWWNPEILRKTPTAITWLLTCGYCGRQRKKTWPERGGHATRRWF